MPSRSLPKCSAFDCSAALWYRRAARRETTTPADVDRHHDQDDADHPPLRVDLGVLRAGNAPDRAVRDVERREHQERGLGERGEVLRLAVPVLVADVRRPHRDADREERQQRCNEVGAGVDRLGHEAEAAARNARPELDPDQAGGRGNRDEGSTPLRAHRNSVRPLPTKVRLRITTFVGELRDRRDFARRDCGGASPPPSNAVGGGRQSSVQAGVWKSPKTAPVGSPAIEKRPTPSSDIGSM